MDREKVIKHFEHLLNAAKGNYQDFVDLTVDAGEEILELLKEQEAEGKWIYCEDASGQDGYKCSECGFFEPWYYDFENHNFITDYAYCPSCGKSMQEGR